MKKSTKAVLLSALVFPGSGHYLLKKPIQGTILFGVVLFCIYSVISTILEITGKLTSQIQAGEIVADANQLRELVSQQLTAGDGQAISISTLVLLICWIVGIVDSYRIGIKQDKQETS